MAIPFIYLALASFKLKIKFKDPLISFFMLNRLVSPIEKASIGYPKTLRLTSLLIGLF